MPHHKLIYRDFLLLGGILILTAIIYSPAIQFEFTNWDDDIHITNNPSIQTLTQQSISDLFIPTDRYMYHPLTMLSYMIEWKIVGEQPWLFHTTNILLHGINICLVFFLVYRLSRNNYIALFIAALFALHPMQVESVAWISARKDILSGCFVLSSVIFYFQWKDKKKTRYYLTSLLLFTCALFSKPSAVVLPLVLILFELLEEKKIGWSLVKHSFLYFSISLVFTLFIVLSTTSHSPYPMQFYSLSQRFVLIIYEVGFYIATFFYPFNLSACYSYPLLQQGELSTVYYGFSLLMLVSSALIFLLRNKIPKIFFGLLLYGVILLPVLQIIPFNNASLVADRYVYLAMLGLLLASVGIGDVLLKKFDVNRSIITIVLFSIIAFMSYASSTRLPVWNDSVSLFSDIIRKNPLTAIAYGNRANAKIAKGDYVGALQDCDTLIALSPEEPKAYFNRGNAYSEINKKREAISDYTKSISLGFQSPHLFYNRGNQYMLLKKYDSAATDFETVLRLSPAYLGALLQMDLLSKWVDNDFEKSVRYLTNYIQYDPNNPVVYMQRAQSNSTLGRYGAALHDAAVAVSLHQNNDATDQFFAHLNNTIDSINTKITTISSVLPISNNVKKRQLFLERSKLYWSLGDTLRAQKDFNISEAMQSR